MQLRVDFSEASGCKSIMKLRTFARWPSVSTKEILKRKKIQRKHISKITLNFIRV